VSQRETDPRLALLLATQADEAASTFESRDSLLTGIQSTQFDTTLFGHTGGVGSVAFSPDGKTLASASGDQTIRLWDVASGQQIGEPLQGHTDGVWSVAFSPDGQTLASGSGDDTIILWEVTTGQPIGGPLAGHTDGVRSVAFSPDGQTLASASCKKRDEEDILPRCTQGEIILWAVTTGQPIGGPLAGHTDDVWSVAFSPDGQTLASGSGDQTIRLWDVATRQPIGEPLQGHIGNVRSVAFSPDGTTLASGSSDNTIILWDVATGQPLGNPLTGHTDWVLSVAFSPDGTTLASASEDQTIRLWDMDWQARACRAAGRNLTAEEWRRYLGDRPYELTCPDLPPHPSAVEAGLWEE
jgi:WD40 repeat protein